MLLHIWSWYSSFGHAYISDPMLPTDSADLIGCSSDVEGEKSQVHDVEGDEETEVPSPDS